MQSSSIAPKANNEKPIREAVDLRGVSADERYQLFKDLIIWHPTMLSIFNEIKNCHRNDISSSEPECLSIFGPTHVGKSEILTQYVNAHPRYIKEKELIDSLYFKEKNEVDITCTPVLRVNVPCPASTGAVISAMFEALGHPPINTKSYNYEKKYKLKYLTKICCVEVIIFDEVQHFIDRKSNRLLMEPSDWLKSLIISLNVPIILAGTHEGKKIFDNKQLRSRFKNHIDFLPFNYFNERDQFRFRKIMQIIDDKLPLLGESKLAVDNTWERIYLATNGRLPYVMDFIKRCLKISLNNELESISLEIMSQVYEKNFYLLGFCEGNPFDYNYNYEKSMNSLSLIFEEFNQSSMNNRIKPGKSNLRFNDVF